MGSGNVPAMATSAMPKAGNTAPGRSPCRSPASTKPATVCGSTGSAPLSAIRRRDRSSDVALAERPGGEHVGEVGAGGGGAAVGRDPLHPAAGSAHEVGRGPEHERRAGGDREAEQPDQAHVVVQRQPRHEHVVIGVASTSPATMASRFAPTRAVREHHALGVGRRAAGELQDRQPVEVVGRALEGGGGGSPGPGLQGVPSDHGRVARDRLDERRQLGVDQHQRHVGVGDADPGLGDELLDRRQAHREREHDHGAAGEPDRLDGGGERPGGGAEEGHVAARGRRRGPGGWRRSRGPRRRAGGTGRRRASPPTTKVRS